MCKISGYGKIYNLGHKALEDLLSGPVTVEEKVDGSQFSFARFGGTLVCRSSGRQLDIYNPDKMFVLAVESVQSIFDKLQDGWIYRGEYLQKPKHNTLKYDRIPDKYVMIFDIDKGDQDYLTYSEKCQEAQRLGFECVPLIACGDLTSFNEFEKLLQGESVLGGTQIEGIVIKNYKQFGVDGKSLKGKFVSEKFKEVHNKDWKLRHPAGKNIKEQIIEDLCTEARWEKAVQHLKEAGGLTDSPKDIGLLMKEIHQDILEECGDEIKDQLFKWAWKDIGRGISRGFPQWYKEKLARKQFNEC